MFLTQEAVAAHPRLLSHYRELQANRNIYNTHHAGMLAANRAYMTNEMLAANAFNGFGQEFWAEIDRQIIQKRRETHGMEILDDLLQVQTVLDIGKTAKLYGMVGDIADDVSVSIDGQAPYSFDHTDYDSDGDPIPVFTAGYGVNWRHAAGLSTVNINLALDSQAAKLTKFNKRLVSYVLDGDSKIQVQNYPAQGLRNHRNTAKINLGTGVGGAGIDLTTADQNDIIDFFTVGAFGQAARANKVGAYDVLWVSSEVYANLDKDYVVGNTVSGTIGDRVKARGKIKDIRETYALEGNEFIGYERRQDVVSPLVGMATGVVPLPRKLPQSNYNFQIMGAMGLQVKRDDDGLSGVIYGADLD